MHRTSLLAGIALLVSTMSIGCTSEEAASSSSEDNLTTSNRLLALGDSIAYGWQPEWEQQQPTDTCAGETKAPPKNAANLQKAVLGRGYPEKAGGLLGLKVDNASCPGEASSSFSDPEGRDNGCREKRDDGLKMTTSWRTAKTQLELARGYLAQVSPKVITVTLGGNDLFLLQDDCGDGFFSAPCVASSVTLGSAGTAYGKNVEKMLTGFFEAGYRGTVVMITTYAWHYTTLSGEPLVFGGFNRALQNAVTTVTPKTPGMKIVIADAYAKFEAASANAESDACKAGLLIDSKNGKRLLDASCQPSCDWHPSQKGHQLIAEAIKDALK